MRNAIGRWSAVFVGLILSVRAAIWTGATAAGLPAVSYTSFHIAGLQGWYWGEVAGCVLAVILLTGPRRWGYRWLNIFQASAALWLGLGVVFWSHFLAAALSIGAGRVGGCVRTGCWPDGVQEWLWGAPLLLACVAMLAMACCNRLHWWIRAAVPAVVFLTARIIQVMIWVPIIMPWLAAEPR